MAMISATVIVTGLVQGVYFRDSTRNEAIKNDLGGWVKNLPDGTVEARFEGPDRSVRRLVEWCRTGPARAQVTGLTVDWGEFTGDFNSFNIEY